MKSARLAVLSSVLLAGLTVGVGAADAFFGENLIEIKLTLPNGDTYYRGASDPVQNLIGQVTLTNKTKKENLNKENITVPTVQRITTAEVEKMQSMSKDEQAAFVEKKKGTADVQVYSVNKDSLGFAYVEPALGPHDIINFIITKVPDEGAPADAKPVVVPRDNKPDHVTQHDLFPNKYLPAGETTPPFDLPVGKYYLIKEPGTYTIKAVYRVAGDSDKASKFAESNEERFRVLPFKSLDIKIDDLKANWEQYERGTPSFDYQVYQLRTTGGFDEVWAVQRIPVRKVDRWEWSCICSVKEGTAAQIAQLSPKSVKVVAQHAKGDIGIYTLDFAKPGVQVKSEVQESKGDAIPKLKADGSLE